MLTRGIPETGDEARGIVSKIAKHTPNDPQPAHYPHSQIVAVSRVATDLVEAYERLSERFAALETELGVGDKAKPAKPGKAEATAGAA